jgi:hypothetical protein
MCSELEKPQAPAWITASSKLAGCVSMQHVRADRLCPHLLQQGPHLSHFYIFLMLSQLHSTVLVCIKHLVLVC